MPTLKTAARLFVELAALVAIAALTADLLYGLLREIRPFGFEDLTYNVVQAGMIVVVVLVGWRLAQPR